MDSADTSLDNQSALIAHMNLASPILSCCVALCLTAACSGVTAPRAGAPVSVARERAVAPYYYLGWGDPPDVQAVMRATGIKWFTLAFMIDGGACDPRWDAERALDDARDRKLIQTIRSAGGDVMVSFGGQKGPTLELHCPSSAALAAAYQRVIAAYGLSAIDIDIESTSYADPSAQQRVVEALLMLRAQQPELAIYITLSSSTAGPDRTLIERAARAGLAIDGWSIMTFDWDNTSDQQAALTMAATDRLKDILMSAYGLGENQAYERAGISSMNGRSDEDGIVTVADMREITRYAKKHKLARLTFWSVNRDRPCPDKPKVVDRCSSLA
ncbi:MAG TPA: hypothetical protein VMF89_03095, partial [Polyangiales bacterium]|nr:hypothetical protein [Polyangiales bacterium]